jgi:hypothetical protein
MKFSCENSGTKGPRTVYCGCILATCTCMGTLPSATSKTHLGYRVINHGMWRSKRKRQEEKWGRCVLINSFLTPKRLPLLVQKKKCPLSKYFTIFLYVSMERVPLSLVNAIEELLGRKAGGSCQETRGYVTAVGIRRADHATPLLSAKVGTNFVDGLRSV